MIFQYYIRNKSKLPPLISSCRDKIVDLIIGGMNIEDAFSVAA
jgi:hypothetical protein